MRSHAAVLALTLVVGTATGAMAESPADCKPGAHPMARVELYFGASRTSSAAWRRFLGGVVTPAFPDGLTTIDAAGQWRGARGLVRERTRILIILYKPDPTADERIERIRAVYRQRFAQTSVLRVDTMVCASF